MIIPRIFSARAAASIRSASIYRWEPTCACMMPRACSFCPAVSTCTRISTGISAWHGRPTRSAAEPKRRHSAVPPLSSTSPIRTDAHCPRRFWHGRAASASIDVAPHLILTRVTDQTLADMKAMIHHEGVSSFKLFLAYPGVLMVDDGSLFKAMRVARDNGALTCVHAENGPVIQVLIEEALAAGHTLPKYHASTRPSLMEGEATQRAIRLAELAEAPLYIVHLSAMEALAAVAEARDRGVPAHAETCPHYLFLTQDEYERADFDAAKYVMTPPLRDHHHQAMLWRGLSTNDLQVISTDHCPFCFNE